MPCSCDHTEPTARETAGAEACSYLYGLARVTGCLDALPKDIKKGAGSMYGVGSGDRVDEVVDMLCRSCNALHFSELGCVIMEYLLGGSGTLYTWWDQHQVEDARRRKAELVNDGHEPGKARFEELLANKFRGLS